MKCKNIIEDKYEDNLTIFQLPILLLALNIMNKGKKDPNGDVTDQNVEAWINDLESERSVDFFSDNCLDHYQKRLWYY